jgi:beta-glucanase (GH16 family)
MENVGREPDAIHGTIHYGDPWPNNSNTGKRIQLPDSEAFSSRFHNFAVFWEKDRIRWFLNGAQYSEKTPDDTDPKNWPFNNRFYLLLNVAIGGNWPGSPDSSTVFPQQMKVDYVRIYDKPYGRLVGPTVVNETQQDVQFTLESGLSDYTYKWTVPSGASITSSNPTGSSTITVAFGGQSGYVTVVATSSKCSSSKTFSMPVLVGAEYQYVPGAKVKDCGCPDTCSSSALERMASDAFGEYSCRERINWVMKNQYLVEKEACQIVYDEFPSICLCDPSNCT